MNTRKLNLTDTVHLCKCDSYESDMLRSTLFKLLDDMSEENGFGSSCLEGKSVLIKPNLLAKRTPDAAVTTSPVIVKYVCEYFMAKKARVTIADSSGGAYNRSAIFPIYKATGMIDAARESGAVLNEDFGFCTVDFPEGRMSKTFNLINPAASADIIVNLSRLKTHSLCEMTSAVKNMFGTVPGLQKAEQHARFPQRHNFASYLVDLCCVNSPQFNITDVIVAMEGNGPAGGTPKKVGALAASCNPFALDLLCSYIMGYSPDEVGTVKESISRGLCPESAELLKVKGEEKECFRTDFVRPDATSGGFIKMMPDIFGGRLRKFLEPRPEVNKKKCVGCGECRKCCPADTIVIINNKAHIRNEKCIKCYCCQELCPAKAIDIKRNLFLKF